MKKYRYRVERVRQSKTKYERTVGKSLRKRQINQGGGEKKKSLKKEERKKESKKSGIPESKSGERVPIGASA